MSAIAVIGHRGTCGTLPENTLEGFASTIEAGVDMLEFDVMATADGQIVIHHDYTITSKLHVCFDGASISNPPHIRSLTLAQIKGYGYRSKLASPAKIPSLQEFFDFLHSLKHPNAKRVRLMIEIKKDPIHPKQTAQFLVKLVNESGMRDRIFYASFDPETLAEVRRLSPKAEMILLFEPDKAIVPEIALQLQAKTLGPSNSLLKDRNQVQALKQKGFKIIPWTINDPKRWSELIEMGVDGIITDFPQNLVRFLHN